LNRDPQPILMIDDSPEDFAFTRRSFSKAGMVNRLFHCADGEQALDYLFRRNQYASPEDSPRPGVILLDLNMPGIHGSEVLKKIKEHDDLRKIPVIILTTSSDGNDIKSCYDAGANSYVVKPVDPDRFTDALLRLKDYWFEIVVLPSPTERED
jgi:two-component system response regulator